VNCRRRHLRPRHRTLHDGSYGMILAGSTQDRAWPPGVRTGWMSFVRGARQTMLHRPYNRAKCTQRSRGSRGRPTRHFRARRSDQRWQEAWNGGWMGYYPGGGLLTSSPAVASWAPNRLDVFVPAATTRFTATHGRLAVITCSSTSNCSPLSAARCLTAWTQSFAASAYTSLGCPSSSAFAGPWCSQLAADS
jgi:hypothetical protein